MSTNGTTNALRTAAIRGWVKDNYGGGIRNAGVTTQAASVAASAALGFAVTVTRLAREFDRQSISFRRSREDPPRPVFSKTELLRGRIASLEARVARLEAQSEPPMS